MQDKKNRQELNLFVAEGDKCVKDLIKSGLKLSKLYTTKPILEEISEKATTIEAFEMKKISSLVTPTSILGIFELPKIKLVDFKTEVVLMLDTIQDPGNLGTIIRIADWFGIIHVYCSLQTTNAFAAKVVQSTMGSLGRVNIIYDDLENVLQSTNIPVYATLLNGQPLNSFDKIKSGIILIGNEGQGISNNLLPFCTSKVTIPKIGHAESLNAAVAAGIVCAQLL